MTPPWLPRLKKKVKGKNSDKEEKSDQQITCRISLTSSSLTWSIASHAHTTWPHMSPHQRHTWTPPTPSRTSLYTFPLCTRTLSTPACTHLPSVSQHTYIFPPFTWIHLDTSRLFLNSSAHHYLSSHSHNTCTHSTHLHTPLLNIFPFLSPSPCLTSASHNTRAHLSHTCTHFLAQHISTFLPPHLNTPLQFTPAHFSSQY